LHIPICVQYFLDLWRAIDQQAIPVVVVIAIIVLFFMDDPDEYFNPIQPPTARKDVRTCINLA
jgi:hypothetical protein